jgi:hypothetical protein
MFYSTSRAKFYATAKAGPREESQVKLQNTKVKIQNESGGWGRSRDQCAIWRKDVAAAMPRNSATGAPLAACASNDG